ATLADHEQAAPEQQQAGDDEDADTGKPGAARQLSASLRAHESLNERLGVTIERLDRAARENPPIVQQRKIVADQPCARNIVSHYRQRRASTFPLHEQLVDLA